MSLSIALNHLVLPVESQGQKYLYFRKKRGWIQANKDMLGEAELWRNSQFWDCPAKKSGSALPKYSVAKAAKLRQVDTLLEGVASKMDGEVVLSALWTSEEKKRYKLESI